MQTPADAKMKDVNETNSDDTPHDDNNSDSNQNESNELNVDQVKNDETRKERKESTGNVLNVDNQVSMDSQSHNEKASEGCKIDVPGKTIESANEEDIENKISHGLNQDETVLAKAQTNKEYTGEMEMAEKENKEEKQTECIDSNEDKNVTVVEEHTDPGKRGAEEVVVDGSGADRGLMGYRDTSEVVVVGDTSDSSPDSSSEEEVEKTSAQPAENTDASINRVVSSERDHSPDRNRKVKLNRFGFEDIRTKGELMPEELPPLEELTITVDESVKMTEVGSIKSILGVLVVIQSVEMVKPLDEETILFLDGHEVLGQVFEVFGPVKTPWYSVRFNNPDNINVKGLHVGQKVYCAPTEPTFTKFVFVNHLQQVRGSDASWEDNNEPPDKYLDYSDDESEKRAKAKGRRKKGKGARGDGQVNEHDDKDQGNKRTRNGLQNGDHHESSRDQMSNRRRNPFQPSFSGNHSPAPRGGQYQARPQNSAPRAQRWPPNSPYGAQRSDFPRYPSQRFGGPPDFRGANSATFSNGNGFVQGIQGQQPFTNRPFYQGGNFNHNNNSSPAPFTNGNIPGPAGQNNPSSNGMFMNNSIPRVHFGQQPCAGLGSGTGVPVSLQDFSRPPPPFAPTSFANSPISQPVQPASQNQGFQPGTHTPHRPLTTVGGTLAPQQLSQQQGMWPQQGVSSGGNAMPHPPAAQPTLPMNNQMRLPHNNVPAYLQNVHQPTTITPTRHNIQDPNGPENMKQGLNVHSLNPAQPSQHNRQDMQQNVMSGSSQSLINQQSTSVNFMYPGHQNSLGDVQNSSVSLPQNTPMAVPIQQHHIRPGTGSSSGQIPSLMNIGGLHGTVPYINQAALGPGNNMQGNRAVNQQFLQGPASQTMNYGTHGNTFQGNQLTGPIVDHRFIQNQANQ